MSNKAKTQWLIMGKIGYKWKDGLIDDWTRWGMRNCLKNVWVRCQIRMSSARNVRKILKGGDSWEDDATQAWCRVFFIPYPSFLTTHSAFPLPTPLSLPSQLPMMLWPIKESNRHPNQNHKWPVGIWLWTCEGSCQKPWYNWWWMVIAAMAPNP